MRTRVLEPSEWQRLGAGFPQFLQYVRPEDIEIVVVEDDDDEIAASMGVMRTTHLEPKYRGNAGVVRQLLRGTADAAQRWGASWLLAFAADDAVRQHLTRLGGVKLPVDSYVLKVGRG
jgi:hypothetical protein